MAVEIFKEFKIEFSEAATTFRYIHGFDEIDEKLSEEFRKGKLNTELIAQTSKKADFECMLWSHFLYDDSSMGQFGIWGSKDVSDILEKHNVSVPHKEEHNITVHGQSESATYFWHYFNFLKESEIDFTRSEFNFSTEKKLTKVDSFEEIKSILHENEDIHPYTILHKLALKNKCKVILLSSPFTNYQPRFFISEELFTDFCKLENSGIEQEYLSDLIVEFV